jgi:CheY-like chemotaxis protein
MEPKRILVIDDDKAVLRALGRSLEGHSVILFDTPAAALAFLDDRGLTFDAILCDIWMPKMDGPAFSDALRHVRPDLHPRIVFMTGGFGADHAREFLADVRQPVVEKPFTRAELTAAIEDVAFEARSGVYSVVAGG